MNEDYRYCIMIDVLSRENDEGRVMSDIRRILREEYRRDVLVTQVISLGVCPKDQSGGDINEIK